MQMRRQADIDQVNRRVRDRRFGINADGDLTRDSLRTVQIQITDQRNVKQVRQRAVPRQMLRSDTRTKDCDTDHARSAIAWASSANSMVLNTCSCGMAVSVRLAISAARCAKYGKPASLQSIRSETVPFTKNK